MKIILLLLLFHLGIMPVFSQSFSKEDNKTVIRDLIQQGDDLKKVNKDEALEKYKKGLAIALDNNYKEDAVALYRKIGVIYHIKKASPKALQMYKKALAIDSTSKTAASLNYNMALLKDINNDYDSALFYLERSLKLFESFETDNSSYKAFLKAAKFYKNEQNFEKALKYAIRAYEGFKKEQRISKLADASSTIGNIQYQIGNQYQALEYHQEALEMEKRLNDTLGIGICYNNIANVLDNLKATDSAIVNYKRALNYFDKDSKQYAVLLANLANTYRAIGEKSSSRRYFLEAIRKEEALKDSISLLYSYNGISSLFLEYDNLEQARKYLNKANEVLPVVSDKRAILSTYENEAEYYKKTKRYEKALENEIKYSDLYKEIYDTEQTKIVQTLQSRFENEQIENEILSLNLANKNAQFLLAEKTQSIKVKNLVLVILGIIVLLITLVYRFFLQRQKNATQAEKIEKLEAIYQGQEVIKKRIARDLHDIITTNFDGLRLRVLALKKSSFLNKNVDSITKDLKTMNQQIRMVSHRLYPLEMYMGKQKFTDIIKSRLTEFQLYGKIFVELENKFPKILNTMPISIQNNIYGILLEVLSNVEKHSHATTLTVKSFRDTREHLNIVFEDNGIGINYKHEEGIGIMNINQRVEMLEGHCKISKTETGTKVHIDFPLPKTYEDS